MSEPSAPSETGGRLGTRYRTAAIGAVVAVGLLVALALAFFVSPWASSSPDGLNKVAIDQGFAEHEEDHSFADGPFAGYETKGVSNERITTGVAGVVGVTVTFAIGLALFFGMKAMRGRQGDDDAAAVGAAPVGSQAGP